MAGDTAGPSTYASNSSAIMGGFKKVTAGPSTYASNSTTIMGGFKKVTSGPNTYFSNSTSIMDGYAKKIMETTVYHDYDDYPFDAFEEEEDFAYEEDDYENYEFDDTLYENEYDYNLSAKFDDLDIPPGVEATLPWLQKTAAEMSNKTKPIPILDDKVDEKYNTFKQFDTVDGHSDHYYVKPELRKALVVKKVMVLTCPVHPLPSYIGTKLSY